jgi:anti-anti-sigma factor
MSMGLKQTRRVVIQPAVDLVTATLPKVRAETNAALDEGAEEIVLNLSNVQMLDSTGVGMLYSVFRTLEQREGRLAIIHASSDVLELLRLMRMDELFRVSGGWRGHAES